MQLVCPAGNLPALKAAVRQGADAVYVGFRDDTNARHFAGLNMDDKQFDAAVAHIRQHQRKPITPRREPKVVSSTRPTEQ